MEYRVEISDTALVDAEDYFQFLQQDRQELEYAVRWWNGLVDALLSLEFMPRRCPAIQEGIRPAKEIRHLIYQSHRIIFIVNATTVTVLRIYHASRGPLKMR